MDFLPSGDHVLDVAASRLSAEEIALILVIVILLTAMLLGLRYVVGLISRLQSHNLTRVDQTSAQVADVNKSIQAASSALIEANLISGQMARDIGEMKMKVAVLVDRLERIR